MTNRRIWILAPIAWFLSIGACQPTASRVPTFPVSGRVVFNGKPFVNASVVFHPVENSGGEVLRPRSNTDENGVFHLTTYDSKDGAPAGDYRVTIEQWSTPNPDGGPKNILPAKFADPSTSGLTARVESGPNQLDPFIIKK